MTAALSPSVLAELQAAEQAATPGPWRGAMDHAAYWCVFGPGDVAIAATERDGIDCAAEDAALIAAARNVLPALLAAAEAVERVRALCDAAEHGATRWEHPLPVPEWVEQVRAALPTAQPEGATP